MDRLGSRRPALGAVSSGAAPDCPFCGTGATERVGHWGGQIITAQWRCPACNSYFEAIRGDFDDDSAGGGPGPPWDRGGAAGTVTPPSGGSPRR